MSRNKKHMAAQVQAAVLAAAVTISGMPLQAMAAGTEQPAQRSEKAGTENEVERKINFNYDWRFYREDGTEVHAEGKDFDDSQWRSVTLPHDYSIELDFDSSSPAGSGGGYLNGGVGWYRKTFVLPESMAGKRISIDFGGVYMDSTTYVNGEMIGNYPYGYSTFAYDITDQLVADGVTENVIAVRVNNEQPSSRWYSGSGIYRNVNLVVTDDVHVERYGTFVKTPDLEEHYAKDEAVVTVETKVANDGELPADAVVISTIYDSEGNQFSEPVTTEAKEIAAGDVVTFEQTINTEKPELWSVGDPNLYEMISEVSVDGTVVDTYETTFGFRWVTMDKNEGFYLNGEYMKLNGMCMHHDQGALGAVANYRAIERQMETMKSMGVNAIRVTHNPAADELIEICNKLGLMVIDEAFDCWESAKRSKDYARFFSKAATHPDAKEGQTWAEFDIKNMVNRGKNDPCIILWSIGNEIVNASVGTATKLVNWVAEVDPTRPATEGFNNFIGGFWDTGMKKVANVTGVVGFNYGEASYDAAHAEYPDWIIMGTETSSAIRSRGFYKKDDSKQIRSSYDDGDTVGWGCSAENAWKANRDRKFVMGEFVWTGFDYIGEPTPYGYPSKSSYFGAVDTAGIPKDAYYIYQSQWTSVEENPMVHLLPHWNWENDDSIKSNGKIKVQAYSNAASVELFLNGESLGEKAFEQKQTSDGRPYQEADTGHIYLEWQVAYEPGELKAVAKDLDGNVIAEDVVKTAGEPAQVRLTPDREVITADGLDLSYMLVEILDKDGNVVPTATNNVKFQISGDGKIVGVDNGDATEVTQSYKGNERKAYSGKAMVIVQSTDEAGSFTVKAVSTGLNSDQAKVFTAEKSEEEQLLGYEALDTIYVRKGETPVLPEKVTAVYSSERKEEKEVTWDEIPADSLNTVGAVTVEGTVKDTGDRVSLQLVVTESLGIRPIHIVTGVGELPKLPETVASILNTGAEEELPVTWEEVTEDQVAQAGSFTVSGQAEGVAEPVTASVRVAEREEVDGADIARKNGTYPIPKASWVQPNGNDPVSAINDGGIYYTGGPAGGRWIAWGHYEADEWMQLEFEEPISTGKVGIDFWTNSWGDSAMDMPDTVTVSYSMDGENWQNVENQSISNKADLKADKLNLFTFDTVTAKFIRWNLHNDQKLSAGITEVHVYQKDNRIVSGTSAALSAIKVNGEDLEGFSSDKDYYTMELLFGAEVPQVTAEAEDENASVFVVPALSNNEATVVQVVSEDGKTRKNYTIEFREAAPVLNEAEIQVENTLLTEDDVMPVSLTAKLQDGKVLSNGVLDVKYTVGNPEIAEWKDGSIYAYWAGTTTLKAEVSYQGVTVESNELVLTIQENIEPKVITGYEQVSVLTIKGQEPVLPAKVKATFDKGLAKQVPVTWDEIDPEKYGKYGSFTVKGSVEGQKLRPEAQVTVKGILGVQQFSCATPLGTIPELPAKARAYYSDGTTDELPVVWEEHPQELFTEDGKIVTVKGTVTDQKVDGSVHAVQATVRVSADVRKGDKFTGYKNGFYLPLGIASFTNDQGSSKDSASELNDNIVSRVESDNNRWCNWTSGHRDEDWAGIIFGLEEVTYKFIDNLEIDFYTDHGASLPTEYTIEYYDGDYFNTRPKNPDRVGTDHPTGLDENWKPVTNLALVAPEELSATETCYFTFDSVRTCAIRIRMKAAEEKCLAITEMGAYEKLTTENSEFQVTGMSVDGKAVEGFDPATHSYTVELKDGEMPEVSFTADQNASVTMIQAADIDQVTTFMITSEDGLKTETYTVSYKNGNMVREQLQKLYDVWAKQDLSVYDKKSAAALETALEAAKAVLEDANASKEAMNQAVTGLVKAIGSLQYGVQKLHLQVAIDEAEKILAVGKDFENTEALAAAVESGKVILNKEEASQAETDEAAYAILDEMFKLAKSADLTSLESLIEAAKSLLDGPYTEESLDELKKAIEEAEKVAADSNRDDDAIKNAYEGLINAIIGLQIKGNKAALKAMLKKANEVLANAAAYVAESIDGLQKEVDDAQIIYDDPIATQDEIDGAVRTLTLKLADARLLGDVNGDGKIATDDSAAVLRFAAELNGLSDEAAASADVNRDGKADTSDAVMILQYAAEKITEF